MEMGFKKVKGDTLIPIISRVNNLKASIKNVEGIRRIIALLSGDKNLESIFKNKQDIHRMVTSKILKKDPSLVTHEERAKGKGVVFGAGY